MFLIEVYFFIEVLYKLVNFKIFSTLKLLDLLESRILLKLLPKLK